MEMNTIIINTTSSKILEALKLDSNDDALEKIQDFTTYCFNAAGNVNILSSILRGVVNAKQSNLLGNMLDNKPLYKRNDAVIGLYENAIKSALMLHQSNGVPQAAEDESKSVAYGSDFRHLFKMKVRGASLSEFGILNVKTYRLGMLAEVELPWIGRTVPSEGDTVSIAITLEKASK